MNRRSLFTALPPYEDRSARKDLAVHASLSSNQIVKEPETHSPPEPPCQGTPPEKPSPPGEDRKPPGRSITQSIISRPQHDSRLSRPPTSLVGNAKPQSKDQTQRPAAGTNPYMSHHHTLSTTPTPPRSARAGQRRRSRAARPAEEALPAGRPIAYNASFRRSAARTAILPQPGGRPAARHPRSLREMNLSDVSPLQRSAPEPSAPNRYRLDRRLGGRDRASLPTSAPSHIEAPGAAEHASRPDEAAHLRRLPPHAAGCSSRSVAEPGGYRPLLHLPDIRPRHFWKQAACWSARRGRAAHRGARPGTRIVAEADGAVTLTGVAHLDPSKPRVHASSSCSSNAPPRPGGSRSRIFTSKALQPTGSTTLPDRVAGDPAGAVRSPSHAPPAAQRRSPPAVRLRSRRLCLHAPAEDSRRRRGGRVRASDALLRAARSRPCRPPATSGHLAEAERTLTRVDRDRAGWRPPWRGRSSRSSCRCTTAPRWWLRGDRLGAGADASEFRAARLRRRQPRRHACRARRHRATSACACSAMRKRRGAAAARNTCLRRGAWRLCRLSRLRQSLASALSRADAGGVRALARHDRCLCRLFRRADRRRRQELSCATPRCGRSSWRISSKTPSSTSIPSCTAASFSTCSAASTSGWCAARTTTSILRYGWARPPRHVPYALNLYRRIVGLGQITDTQGQDRSAPALIAEKVAGFYRSGVPARMPGWVRKATVLSWDMSRNHFAKAFCVAEALSRHVEVQLISFRFFEEPIFRPLAEAKPPFEMLSFEGADFPAFFDTLSRAVDAIDGDVIYAVKPRLTSLGAALLANHSHRQADLPGGERSGDGGRLADPRRPPCRAAATRAASSGRRRRACRTRTSGRSSSTPARRKSLTSSRTT